MKTRTLFEHESISYSELGWVRDDARIQRLEKLNQQCGVQLLQLGRHNLSATQYVGLIRAGDISLQILPKIDYPLTGGGGQGADERGASAASNLMTMLTYALNLKIHPGDTERLKKKRGDWFEWLTFLFASELSRQLCLGLDRAYIDMEEALPLIRGKWLLTRQYARRPLAADQFEVCYADFSARTLLNRVFFSAVTRLLAATRDRTNYRLLLSIRGQLIELEGGSEPPTGYQEMMHFSRLNRRFQTAYQLADLFLQSSVFHFSAGRRDLIALVFDMNRLFEEYMAAFLQKHKSQIFNKDAQRVSIISQALGRHDFFLKRTYPSEGNIFRLKPDILIHRDGRLVCIADTKYKILDPEKRNLGLSEEDSYQMLAYAVGLGCQRVLMIYPQPDARVLRAEFQVRGHSAQLSLAGINLHQPLSDPLNMINEMNQAFVFIEMKKEKEEDHATL